MCFDCGEDFKRFDEDGDGLLDLREFLDAGAGTEAEFRAADGDGSGELRLEEFATAWKRPGASAP